MPKLKMEIPEVVNSISRPVVHAVVADLTKWLALREPPPVVYLGSSTQPPTKGGLGNEAKNLIFNSEALMVIEVTEDYPDHLNGTQPQIRPNEIVEFADNDLGVFMKPMYQPVRITMNFKIRTEDETRAKQITQSWKRHITGLKEVYLHTVGYHYPIPLRMMAILMETHKLREANFGYGNTTNQWFKDCFSSKMTVISDMKGKNPFFAIRENQTEIQGWYEFDGKPPVFEKDAEGGSWTTQVTYVFQYDRVEGMVMDYPLMVHNQMIDLEFVDTNKLQTPEDIQVYRNLTGALSFYFGSINKPVSLSGEPGLPIPHFDDWLPNSKYAHHQNLSRILLSVDPNDRNLIIDLNDLGEWVLDPLLLNHIRVMKNGIFHPRQAIVLVNLYEGQNLMDHSWMSIDDNLVIRCSRDLNPRKVYHLVISLNYNLSTLSAAALRALALDGAFAKKILLLVEPRLMELGFMPEIFADGSMDLSALNEAAYESYLRAFPNGLPDGGSRKYVGNFTLIAHKES